MTSKLLLMLAVCFTLASSCGRKECANTNPIFDKFSPTSQEYKSELAMQLTSFDNSALRYWLKEYSEINNKQYLIFHVQGDGLCAKMVMAMEHWSDNLKYVKAAKGKSYQGAEFANLTFDVVQDSVQTNFVFKNVDKVID